MPDQEMIAARPLPEVTPLTEPFWTAARERKLVIQRCDACRVYRFPPEPACLACGSPEGSWTQVSGRATLWSWTVGHPPLLPFFAQRAPWPVAIVQLDEGPRMVTNVPGLPLERYEVGLPLEADFVDIEGDITLVVFRRTGSDP